MTLTGRFCISEPNQTRTTMGDFGPWMEKNRETFQRYFGVKLFAGSLNVAIEPAPPNLHRQLDRGSPKPALVIPKEELRYMPPYLGDAQAWRAEVSSERIEPPHPCWVLRRIGSRVPTHVLEIVSTLPIVKTYGLRADEKMVLTILQPDERPIAGASSGIT